MATVWPWISMYFMVAPGRWPAGTVAGSGELVGVEQALDGDKAVLEQQFAFLESAYDQFVCDRNERQTSDRLVQVLVFGPQILEPNAQVGGFFIKMSSFMVTGLKAVGWGSLPGQAEVWVWAMGWG